MKRNLPIFLSAILAVLLLVISPLVFTNCKGSGVDPSLLTPNPPVPPAQPLILVGYVKDISNSSSISGATARITKSDNTFIATVATDNNGKYSYNATSLTETSLIVTASKDGYGFRSEVASLVKASNLALIGDILLARLVAVSAPVTVATGGTASAVSNQSVANQPLTVTVPPNAVTAAITLTVAPISASQVPASTSTSNSTVLAAGQFGPSNTQFQQPVTISFPLPSAQTPGKTFPLMQLNEQTNQYTNSGFTATVNTDGTSASAPVTHFTIYALAEDASIDLIAGTAATGSSDYYGLTEGTGTKLYVATSTYSSTPGSGNVNESWLKDIISTKSQISFDTKTTTIGGNFPALPANYQSGGLQVNPNVAGKGTWEYRWYVLKKTTPYTGTAASGTTWSRTINIIKVEWINDVSKTGWYWSSHDQGGLVSGPY